MKRKRSRGLGGVASTKEELKRQVKACGSHYFDPGSMRFFNARLNAVYPAPNKKATYFVETKGGGRWSGIPRHATIGVFKDCRVQSLGKGIGRSGKATGVYKTADKARKIARAIQSKAEGYGTTLKTRKKRR